MLLKRFSRMLPVDTIPSLYVAPQEALYLCYLEDALVENIFSLPSSCTTKSIIREIVIRLIINIIKEN